MNDVAAPAAAEAGPFGIAAGHVQRLRTLFERTPNIDRVWIFGSRSCGRARPDSDVDLAIDAAGMSDQEFAQLASALDQLPLILKIDAVHWQRVEDSTFRAQIERDRQVFWQPRRGSADDRSFSTIELKPFQRDVLRRLHDYFERLGQYSASATRLERQLAAMDDAQELIDQARNFPRKTWEALRSDGQLPAAFANQPYSERWTPEGNARRPIPNVCLKVPTGGGKTLLAASAVARAMATYYRRSTGVVLWIVPNEAIFRQTRKALIDADHPYRQILNVAAAGRVKVVEKDSPLSRLDVESHLVVMLLMLQSAARLSKETLRLFRDRGDVHGFFPREDDLEGHWKVLQQVRNLDVYSSTGLSQETARATRGAVIKDSLGNVLRAWRPMVVIDEGHHTYTDNALATIDGFNPSLVLELSATPRVADGKRDGKHGRGSNLLVDVRGTDLDAAEMIKLPINVDVRSWQDWKSCLTAAVAKVNDLQHDAERLNAESQRYIRPILLVQVERTGREQRDLGFIHADDARAHLKQLGFSDAQIAEKTSEKNELSQPENLDLLSPANKVRAIITKQALQEGWDCPFAYVLCALAAGRQQAALTQLIGRILRQPNTAKTPVPALNECYVYCNDAQTADVVNAVKKSLEEEGMGDLVAGVRTSDGNRPAEVKRLQRRTAFSRLRIFLPRVTIADQGRRRELVYDSDIVGKVDWRGVNPAALIGEWAPNAAGAREATLRMGLEILESDSAAHIEEREDTDSRLDRARLVRALVDLVPNPWLVWDWVAVVIAALRQRGFSERQLANSKATMIEALRAGLVSERDRLAQLRFNELVSAGDIRFTLQADALDYELPTEVFEEVVPGARPLFRNDGQPIQKSLLEPVYESSVGNRLETEFACYLDSQSALQWWHRNVARAQYGLQGWRRDKIYPDFVFARVESDGRETLVVMETKGLHLHNDDTSYKQELLARLNEMYRNDQLSRAGELALVARDGTRLVCDLVFDQAWEGVMAARHFGAAPASTVAG